MAYQFSQSVDDAKTKFCPFVRDEFLRGVPFNGQPHCIASACMAWRWAETWVKGDDGNLNVLSGDTHGICGLAGDPRVGHRI